MFGTIRRHQKWLWIVISTVTIISFVAFFSPQRRRQAGWTGPRDSIGTINGRHISRTEWQDLGRETRLYFGLFYNSWGDNDARGQMAEFMRTRLLLIEKLRELDIQVSESAIAQWITEVFRDPSEKSTWRDHYEQVVNVQLPNQGLNKSDFERFARHEVGIQHLKSLASTAGKLVTPQEAETLFRHENEEAETEAVFLSSSNYVAQVSLDPAAIATYFTNFQAQYRIPERMQVSYVKFASSNYLAEAEQILAKNTNMTQIIASAYQQRGTNDFKDTNNVPLSADAAKLKIREELRDRVALDEAQKKAVEFANALYEVTDKSDALEKLAAAKGLQSAVTEPFSQSETPRGLLVPMSFPQTAFKLTPEEPIAEQYIQADDGFYVIALQRKIPSEVPPLESVLARVTQDYQSSKALELTSAAGRDIQAAVTNALAAGKTFQAAVAEKNASAVALPAFTRKASTVAGIPNPGDASRLVSTAFTLAPGKVSNYIPTRTGGFLVYLKAINPVSDAKVKADLPEFTKTLRQSHEYRAFAEWFRRQMETSRMNLPGDKQRASLN